MLEELAEPAHPLGGVTEDPELLQGDEQVEPEIDLIGLQRPGEGRAQVGNVRHDDLRTLLRGDIGVERSAECDRVVIPGVPLAQLGHLAELVEVFERELANRLQHEEAAPR